jgi:hypothetical protein
MSCPTLLGIHTLWAQAHEEYESDQVKRLEAVEQTLRQIEATNRQIQDSVTMVVRKITGEREQMNMEQDMHLMRTLWLRSKCMDEDYDL